MKIKPPKFKLARKDNGESRCLERVVRHPIVVAWEAFKKRNPPLFDCTTLNMHPAHHRYLANRLEVAFQAGWEASKKMPNAKLCNGLGETQEGK